MSDSERWIIKALHEASGEVRELLVNALLGDVENVQLLIRDAWERETVAAWQLAHLIFRDADPLPLHNLEWLEQRREQVPDAYEQVRQFSDLRGQITGVLSMISGREWEQSAHHRFRGRISVREIARNLHQGDLEVLAALRTTAPPHRRRSAQPRPLGIR